MSAACTLQLTKVELAASSCCELTTFCRLIADASDMCVLAMYLQQPGRRTCSCVRQHGSTADIPSHTPINTINATFIYLWYTCVALPLRYT